MSEFNVKDKIGAIVIGSWITSLLFSYELYEFVKYLTRHPRTDSYILKLWVAALFVIELAFTISVLAHVYLHGVLHWGDQHYILEHYSNPSLIASSFTSAVNSLLTQLFFIHRCWVLTNRSKPLMIFLLLGASLPVIGQVWGALTLASYHKFAQRNNALFPISLALISSAAIDTIIAMTLVLSLRNKSERTFTRSTKKLVAKLVTISISTGSIAAALAIFAVIVFVRNPKSNAAPSITWSIGRVYAISTLFTLNNRRQDNSIVVSASN